MRASISQMTTRMAVTKGRTIYILISAPATDAGCDFVDGCRSRAFKPDTPRHDLLSPSFSQYFVHLQASSGLFTKHGLRVQERLQPSEMFASSGSTWESGRRRANCKVWLIDRTAMRSYEDVQHAQSKRSYQNVYSPLLQYVHAEAWSWHLQLARLRRGLPW